MSKEGEEIGETDAISLYVDDNMPSKKELGSFVGKKCDKADPEIKKLGITPIYIASNTEEDMTVPIQNDTVEAKEFKITKLIDYNKETSTAKFIVQSKYMSGEKARDAGSGCGGWHNSAGRSETGEEGGTRCRASGEEGDAGGRESSEEGDCEALKEKVRGRDARS